MRLLLASALLALALIPDSAFASTVSVTPPSGVVDGVATTITVSGSADSAQALFVVAQTGAGPCPSYAYAAGGTTSIWLSPDTGTAVGTGPYSIVLPWTPSGAGATRICAFLATSRFGLANTSGLVDVDVAAPPTDLTVQLNPSAFVPGDPVTATIDATTARSGRELRWTFTLGGAPCPSTAPSGGAIPMTANVKTTKSASQSTTDDGVVRMCAWVVRTATGAVDRFAEGTATRQSNAQLSALYAADPLTEDGEEQFDRLELMWRTRAQPADERVYIWDENPADGADPKVVRGADNDDEFELLDSADDERDLRVRHFMGFRQFWWQVKTTSPWGASLSPIRSVTITPSPLDPDTVKVSPKLQLKHSSKTPGTVRLRIASSPRARVRLTVRYRGRVYARRHYTEGVGALRGIEFRLSCARTGVFSFEVRIRDPYGAKAVRRGHWTSSASRCASLRAEERRKAEAERREKQKAANPTPSSGGSGSKCDPNYVGACLDPNAYDYDCEGGGGDGPLYVKGPITVVGDDHFGLDTNDPDDIACE